MAIFENKLFRFGLMVVLWCAGFLPGMLVLKNDMTYGGLHFLFLLWGISLLLFMITFTLLDVDSSNAFRWILGGLVLATGGLGTACGVITLINIFINGERTFAVMWVAQLITFSSLMLISFMIISWMTDVGHTIYQIVCTAACYIILVFDPLGWVGPAVIVIFLIAGYLGFMGLRRG